MIPMNKSQFNINSKLWFILLILCILIITGAEVNMFINPTEKLINWLSLIVAGGFLLHYRNVYEALIKLHYSLFKWNFYIKKSEKALKKIKKINEDTHKYFDSNKPEELIFIEMGKELEKRMSEELESNKKIKFFED